MREKKKTLVLGASDNPNRYSYLALQRLQATGHPVAGIGKKPGKVGEVEIVKDKIDLPDIDTITLYLNPQNQQEYYDYILSLHPKRIIFNPGTENPELVSKARQQGIQTLNACTLVMLSTNQY